MARKARKSARKGRAAPRWLWVVAVVVLVAAIVVVARNRPDLSGGRSRAADRTAGIASPAIPDPGPEIEAATLQINSDWDRLKLRSESEVLRLFRPDDRAALYRLTSRVLRGALEDAGVDRAMIDERPGSAAAVGTGRAPIQWKIQVPPRASLFKINDAMTQAITLLGGNVIRGAERPAQTAGIALDLRLGYGNRVTHAVMVEPNPAIADAGTQMAFVVIDLQREPESLFESYRSSPVPLTVALRPDQPALAATARALRDSGREIFLHMPMEPRGYPQVDPGKNAILLDLSRIEIEERIDRCLSSVGPAEGIMSRLGGAAVNDPDVMRAVLGEVKRRDLLFIDAHGAGPSVVDQVGEETGARTMTLGGSLDVPGPTIAGVRARLKQLVELATHRGTLVVTFKASATVLQVLQAESPKLREQGVEIVPASRLVL